MTGDHRDLVIADFADENARLVEQNHQLIDLVAALTFENYCLYRAFIRTLTVADDARRAAQQQCRHLWEVLQLQSEEALRREREVA